MRKDGSWVGLEGEVTGVELEHVPCASVRMDVFDALTSAKPPIVRANGDLIKVMEDVREGVTVSDALRELLLCEESEVAGAVPPEARAEFLWRLFEALCLGGACCQFEDTLEPYLDATRRLYKELVAVQRGEGGRVEVASAVYAVRGLTLEGGQALFPVAARNSFCYLCMDPMRRVVRVWYHAAVPFW